MNLATLEVTKEDARAAVMHYRKAVKEHRRAEDRAILRGYNQIIRGRKLIVLPDIIRAGGEDELGRPRLAVMRADQTHCRVRRWSDGSLTFTDGRWRSRSLSLNIQMPTGTLSRGSGPLVEAESIVPLIPPQLRPSGALSNYHILWEADWKTVPADPALIKHLGGDLWAVVAVWDLTELERAVLGGRRSGR